MDAPVWRVVTAAIAVTFMAMGAWLYFNASGALGLFALGVLLGACFILCYGRVQFGQWIGDD